MEMPEVADDMKRLAALFTGTWRGDETLHPSDWDPHGGPAHGVWQVRAVADGFCLAVDYQESRDGQVVYRGHGVHGWDAGDGCFYAYWFDNLGVMQKAGNRATFDGVRYTYSEASPAGHNRFTYDFSDGFAFTIERSLDGQDWKPMHEGRYQRAT